MAAPTRNSTRRQSTKPARRDLLEYVRGGSPLEVDEAAGVIKRVKVLGRFSRNRHEITEAVNGTEYTPGCMREAVPLYEGTKVKANHPPDRTKPAAERDVDDSFGVLRNVRVESDEHGDPAVWADLHYLKSHPLAGRVVEDVKRGLGVYGLSHNAASPRDRERVDPATKRLVIESLALVRSVDLVDKPATNRNLWESEETPPVTATRRQLFEAIQPQATGKRAGWLTWLLEDDAMGAGLDDAVEAAPADGSDPEDKLWAGIVDAILSIANQYRESGDPTAAGKKITQYLKAHAKLTGDAEPDDVEEDDEMGDEDPDKAKGDDKPKDKTESAELAQLKAEKHVRQLCESMGHAPTELQVESLTGLQTDAKRRQLIESFKATGPTGGPRKYAPPRSKAPGTPAKTGTRDVTESAGGAADDLAALRG